MPPEHPDPARPPAAPISSRTRSRLAGAALIAAGILVIVLFGVDWRGLFGHEPAAQATGEITPGALAPAFEAENLDGEVFDLSAQTGEIVLLNFWATWCEPCRIEMPFLQARHERFGEDLAVVAVDFDEPRNLVAAFAAEYGLSFEVVLDPGGFIQDLYKIRGYPTSVFLDREGVIRFVHIGRLSEDQLDAYLRDLGLD